MIAVLKSL